MKVAAAAAPVILYSAISMGPGPSIAAARIDLEILAHYSASRISSLPLQRMLGLV